MLPPVSYEKAVDRVAFRDGFDPKDAYLFMPTSQGPLPGFLQSNALARYTDLGEVWLFHNTTGGQGSRNMLVISNGKPCEPRAACSLEAQADLGDVSAVSSMDHGVSGVDWTRTVVHWRGHYFAVLDRVEANADDEFNLACRWRTPHAAELKDGIWSAMAPSLGVMRIQNTDGLRQSAEYWENDGATRPYVLTQFKRTILSKGQSDSLQNLIFVSGPDRRDEFTARRAGPRAMLVGGRTASGEHLALIGTDGQLPLAGFQSDAAIYDVADNALGLAGTTSLRAAMGGRMRPVLTAEAPVNLRLDCQSGQGELEVPGDKTVSVKIGDAEPVACAPGKRAVTVAQAGALPSPAAAVAALWAASKPPETQKTATEEPSPFRVILGDQPLSRPFKRLSRITLSSKPPSAQPLADLTDGMYSANLAGYVPNWATTDGLEITITLPEPTKVSRLRLVGVLDHDPKRFGEKMYGPNDFTFSLVLSNDGFQHDVRTVSRPATGFEESVTWPLRYFGLVRLPTFRIDVNDTARQIKLLPRAASKDKPSLSVCELEVYAQEPADEMTVQAAVADLDGKGEGKLVVATSQHEVAAYGPDGVRLWHKPIGGDLLEMVCADLDSNGRSEAIVYDTTETLYRFNGDGTERPRCDFRPPQYEMVAKRKEYQPDEGHVLSMAVWSPDGKKKELALWSGVWYRVDGDGKIQWTSRRTTKGSGRVPDLFPGETDVMGTVAEHLELWSSRVDQDGNYVRLASKQLAGSTNCGPLVRGFGWVQAVNTAQHKGVLAANGGSVNWFPLATLLSGNPAGGWGFDTCGVAVTAALAGDIDSDGVPEVFLARQDGFVNVFKLADGARLGLLNTGEPILGMAMLKGKGGKPCLAVGTKFGVHLFGADLKEIGSHQLTVPAAGFAGPGGKDKDRVYVVDVAGNVTVLVLK
jgi:hypothetical protein